jgi:hypothetical protein
MAAQLRPRSYYEGEFDSYGRDDVQLADKRCEASESFYNLSRSYVSRGYDIESAKRMARLCMEASE